MSDEPLPLSALRGFEAATRTESFTAAARELHLTHGAISRQIRTLEDAVGAKLFERRNRRVIPTPAGRLLHRHVTSALEMLRLGAHELRRGTGGPLVVSCEPTLTQQWLIPRLSGLRRWRPEFALHVATGGGALDFARTGVDLAIRRADFAWPASIAATPLMDEWLGPVCHPSLATRRRPVGALRIPRLHTSGRPDAWSWWQERVGMTLSASREQTFEHFWLSIQAAVAGLGMAIGPYPLIERELREGRLVAPYGLTRGDRGYVMLTPRPVADDPRLVDLVAWLKREAAAMERRMPARLRSFAGARRSAGTR